MSAPLGRALATLLWAFLWSAAVSAAEPLPPDQAARHVGERAEVCGVVASAKYAVRSRGRPTFLNLGRPYPDHVFTVLIWGDERRRFRYPPEDLEGQRICVEGTIGEYEGTAQIVVSEPGQIRREGD